MLPVAEDTGPRQRILFPGGRLFKLEESSVDSIGRRSLPIVERGKGLRRAVVLIGFEVCWIVMKLRAASQTPDNLKFLGRLNGGRRSLTAWVRVEVSSVQAVVTMGSQREQIFIPMSAFGDSWKGVALVMEGFNLGMVGETVCRNTWKGGSGEGCPTGGSACLYWGSRDTQN